MRDGDSETMVHTGSWPPAVGTPHQKPGTVFVAQADYLDQLRDRTKAVHDLEPFAPLDEDTRRLHTRALEAFETIESYPQMMALLVQYCETIEAADLRPALELLGTVKGAEQIVHVARGNFLKQADRLLIGAFEIATNGRTVVTNFGIEKSFHSIEQIQQTLQEIFHDMQEVRDVIEDIKAGTHQGNMFGDLFGRLEKYMFDGKNLEMVRNTPSTICIIQDPAYPDVTEQLKKHLVLPQDRGNAILSLSLGDVGRGDFSRKIDLANEGDRETDNIFLQMESLPQTVILHVAREASFQTNNNIYQELLVDWLRLPYHDRPRIIVYTEGFVPALRHKHDYQGFLFCSTLDELRNVVTLSQDLAQEQDLHLYDPDRLVVGQREAYDNSDLREWENKTADTYQSLLYLVRRFQYRNDLLKKYLFDRYGKAFDTDEKGNLTWHTGSKREVAPEREIKTILDLGTGEGRIAGMLARLGYNVVGLDISQAQSDRGRLRIREEGEGLRGERDHPGLSYRALRRLEKEGEIGLPLEDDKETALHYLTVQGSFFELHRVLNQALIEWPMRFPDVDPYAFFGETRWNQYAFSDRRDMFLDAGFDAAMFNWHTWDEIGTPENQKMVLEQILNVLNPGGELILEIPDRKIEPYASALATYHHDHPDEPYGTIRDAKPEGFSGEGGDLYPPRYFPDINELVLLLKSVGYEIDPKADVQSYPITAPDPATRQPTLTLKEYFITARKSKD